MRIAAVGDQHLGRSYYARITADGVNQRQADFENTFARTVDAILAADVEAVLLLGDLFDHPRPTFRSYRIAQAGLRRLADAGLAVVAITGNHDTPRLPGRGSPYSPLADALGRIHFVYRLDYERIDLPGLAVHAIPQTLTSAQARDCLERARANTVLDRTNVLITHPRLLQVPTTVTDINEIELDQRDLRDIDLVVLGHFHNFTTISERMWYAGAPDSFSFADEPQRPKGFVIVDTDTGTATHQVVAPSRPLVTAAPLLGLGLDSAQLTDAIVTRLLAAPPGAVVRVFCEQVEFESFRLVDQRVLAAAATERDLLHYRLETSLDGSVARAEPLPRLDALPAQWRKFVAEQELAGFDRSAIVMRGQTYIDSAIEASLP